MKRLSMFVLLALLVHAAPAIARNSFKEVDLVSDLSGRAAHLDANLINPWGILAGPEGRVRVSAANAGLSTIYSASGIKLTPTITIPPAGSGSPTGLVPNRSGSDFVVTSAGKSRSSRLIFASEDGSISGWNPQVDANNAILAVSTPDGVYKGLALGRKGKQSYLFAANFHAGTVDVFDGHFAPVSWPGAFLDPALPAGYAPFNIANLDGRLYVSYAKQKPDRHDDEAGPGFGYIDVYTSGGQLQGRLVSAGPLNAPWGMALAPEGFGSFGGALLVGNFGDGVINVFNPKTGRFLGHLNDGSGNAISIEGLWGLAFAKSGESELEVDESPTLYFSAGIEDESHGLLGTLSPTTRSEHDVRAIVQSIAPEQAALRVSILGANPGRLSDGGGIRFRITTPTPAPVRLQVFDVSGRAVAEPVRADLAAGDAVVNWDGTDSRGTRVSAGIYFYRAISAGHVATGRLLLMP